MRRPRAIVVPRTNNVQESLFRTIKRQCRRLHGRGHVCRDIEDMFEASPLVLNLRNADYCETVYGGTDYQSIAERFSAVDPSVPAGLLRNWRKEKLSVRLPRKFERQDNFPQRFVTSVYCLLCLKGADSMAFDVDKLFVDCKEKIQQFAREHPDETFYAFAIDANMLCLNSIEDFRQTLNEYQSRWKRQTRNIESLADMTEEDMRDEEFGLNLAEKCSGLDRSDEKAVLQVINEGRSRRRSEGCDYLKQEGIKDLQYNTGDWEYQGFADMEDENGFDDDLYNDHYYAAMESDDGHAPHLIARLLLRQEIVPLETMRRDIETQLPRLKWKFDEFNVDPESDIEEFFPDAYTVTEARGKSDDVHLYVHLKHPASGTDQWILRYANSECYSLEWTPNR